MAVRTAAARRYAAAMDPRDFDRRVLDAVAPIIADVRVAHLNLSTPCTEWTLHDLLRHMIGHLHGFAAAAHGEPTDPHRWDGPSQLAPDPAGAYRAAAARATAAFGVEGLLDRTIDVHGYGVFPARVALHMHAVDFLGHGWDVAKTLGVDEQIIAAQLDDELCAHALAIAGRWPDTPATWGPGAPFAHRVAVPETAPAYQRLMGFLGRDPGR